MRSQRRQAQAARNSWAVRAIIALADPCYQNAQQQPEPLAGRGQTVIAGAASQMLTVAMGLRRAGIAPCWWYMRRDSQTARQSI